MIFTIDELRILPTERHEALFEFESLLRERCSDAFYVSQEGWDGEAAYVDNLNAFCSRMGFEELATISQSSLTDLAASERRPYFERVQRAVDRIKLHMIYDKGLRDRLFDPRSLKLSVDLKIQLHAYIEQIKQKILEANLPEKKRELILQKIHDLSLEIDRDRTRLEIFTSFALEVSDSVDAVHQKLSPTRRLLERLYRKLTEAKEEQARLGVDDSPKQIAHGEQGE